MSELEKVRVLYQLKNVNRTTSVGTRKESSAEHSWSSLLLADYFLSTYDLKLDRLKVYELLMYHDIVEIETGDICISKEEERKHKAKLEMQGAQVLKEKIPKKLKLKYIHLFTEFEEKKTAEAKFAKAIDALDAEIQEMDYKEDWKGWTEEFLRRKKEHLFKDFAPLREFFEETTAHARKQGYFDQ